MEPKEMLIMLRRLIYIKQVYINSLVKTSLIGISPEFDRPLLLKGPQ